MHCSYAPPTVVNQETINFAIRSVAVRKPERPLVFFVAGGVGSPSHVQATRSL